MKGFRLGIATLLALLMLALCGAAAADADPIRVSSLSEPQSVISEQDVSIAAFVESRYMHSHRCLHWHKVGFLRILHPYALVIGGDIHTPKIVLANVRECCSYDIVSKQVSLLSVLHGNHTIPLC